MMEAHSANNPEDIQKIEPFTRTPGQGQAGTLWRRPNSHIFAMLLRQKPRTRGKISVVGLAFSSTTVIDLT